MNEKLTARDIIQLKKKGRKIVMITAYDYAFARLVDQAGVDIILVGDSASMVMMGYRDTRFVTLRDMITFCKSVSRGVERALVVGDMPFMSFQVSKEEAVRNAGRLVKDGMVDAVKLEGGVEYADIVRAIVNAGIPVMGHIGLTPQSAATSTGYRLVAKEAEDAVKLVEDAKALEEAGAFAIVAEYVTAEVAEYITKQLKIPVIGIGSGPGCDGQVLVLHDALGLYEKSPPFSKRYVDLASIVKEAISRYRSEVLEGMFPSEEHTKHMKKEALEEFLNRVRRPG
ncbi:MAG: 3-methyl-2-oxobutanoate hydroxymethyltransferase [Nitrososphaerota archaeon]